MRDNKGEMVEVGDAAEEAVCAGITHSSVKCLLLLTPMMHRTTTVSESRRRIHHGREEVQVYDDAAQQKQ
jgi:hypothetical protein